jgi:hypothetical protein
MRHAALFQTSTAAYSRQNSQNAFILGAKPLRVLREVLKTARTLEFTIPASFLSLADELIS